MVNPGYPDPSQMAGPPQGNGLAVAGFVCGLLACILCFFWPAALILGLLGIIFGAIGLGKAKRVGKGRGMALAGLICGVLGLVLMVVFIAIIVAAVTSYAKGGAKTEVTKLQLMELAADAYPQWASSHPDKACPASINELADYAGRRDMRDPWGNRYVMLCGPDAPPGSHGFAVISVGPDGKQGTDDDVKSW